jgi:hypothetical protein
LDLVVEDLKQTTAKGFWWLGRKIHVRMHLAVYFLQKIYDLTDRAAEYGVKDNAAYQLFCGVNIVKGWHPPDHTSIENFRNRLSPETQRILACELARIAVELGFADPREVDLDSTVQEANIAYPSDAALLTKLAGMGKKVFDYLKQKTKGILPRGLDINMQTIKEKSREYFFLGRNTGIEKRRRVFGEFHKLVKSQLYPLIDICTELDARRFQKAPWNIQSVMTQIKTNAKRYLLDVAHFIRTHKIKCGKILSFHSKAVACIKKGKPGKDKEFGRVFQLGRIKGNFMFAIACTDIRMDDKAAFSSLLQEHRALFGDENVLSATADKGYWSAKNLDTAKKYGVQEIGLQRPARIKSKEGLPSEERQSFLKGRRAGIEPLIGHAKHGGQLGRSRMKSDKATLGAGYGSVLGLNLRQLIRCQAGKMKKVA